MRLITAISVSELPFHTCHSRHYVVYETGLAAHAHAGLKLKHNAGLDRQPDFFLARDCRADGSGSRTRTGSDQAANAAARRRTDQSAASRSTANPQPIPFAVPATHARRISGANAVGLAVELERVERERHDGAPFESSRGSGLKEMARERSSLRHDDAVAGNERFIESRGEAVACTISTSVESLPQTYGHGGTRGK